MMAAQVEIVDNGEIIDSLSPHTSGDYSSTILLREENHEYDVVKNCFLSGMDLHAGDRPRHRREDAGGQPPAGQLPQLVQSPVRPDGVQPGGREHDLES